MTVDDAGREHAVTVGNTRLTVTVYRKSKSVWVAVGDHLGDPLRVQGKSEGAAIERWREAATHKGS
jgi:hypothetical protein